MLGSVTRLVKKEGWGFILGEDGCEVYFDLTSTNGLDARKLSVGEWVEYEISYAGARLQAQNVRPVLSLHARKS